MKAVISRSGRRLPRYAAACLGTGEESAAPSKRKRKSEEPSNERVRKVRRAVFGVSELRSKKYYTPDSCFNLEYYSLFRKLNLYSSLNMASKTFVRTLRAASKQKLPSGTVPKRNFSSALAARPAAAAQSKVHFAPAQQTRGVKTIDFAGTKEVVYGMQQ